MREAREGDGRMEYRRCRMVCIWPWCGVSRAWFVLIVWNSIPHPHILERESAREREDGMEKPGQTRSKLPEPAGPECRQTVSAMSLRRATPSSSLSHALSLSTSLLSLLAASLLIVLLKAWLSPTNRASNGLGRRGRPNKRESKRGLDVQGLGNAACYCCPLVTLVTASQLSGSCINRRDGRLDASFIRFWWFFFNDSSVAL